VIFDIPESMTDAKSRCQNNLPRTYSVYVVELDRRIWNDSWKFRKANPSYMGGRECLYVGMTSLSPQVRFKKHKKGSRSRKGIKISSWVVENYGLYLRPSLYANINPLTREQATVIEGKLAKRLQNRGYAVWWN
jgi:hypothetical protein